MGSGSTAITSCGGTFGHLEFVMPKMRTCGEEVKARGAQLTIITDNPRLAEGLDPSPIVIPNNVRRTESSVFFSCLMMWL